MVAAEKLPELRDLTVEQAECWIEAALAEAKALRQHDEELYPVDNDPAAVRTAEQFHAAWRHWADAAEALYERVRPLLQAKQHLTGAHDLDYAIGRTRAMLQIAPAAMLAREQQVRLGNVKSVEEVRRELRASSGR